MDFATMTDAELSELFDLVRVERDRRETVATAKQQMEDLNRRVYEAKGGDEREFVPVLFPHDAYPLNAIVIFEGKRYQSVINANVWSPTSYPDGWRLLTSGPVDPPVIPEPQPVVAWAAGQTVNPGDRRSYNGKVYVAVQAHATAKGWEPPAVPALWSLA